MTLAKIGAGATAGVLLLGLFACDNGPSAVRSRDRDTSVASYSGDGADGSASSYRTNYSSDRGADRGGYRSGRSPSGGDTWWASSRNHSATESADYHFKRDGADFGASDVADYVSKAHAFVGHPPRGTLRLERRNGDELLYDPRSNVFAVKTKDGAPRTMFKPRDGRAYWDQQVARENQSGRGSGSDDQRS